MKNQKLGANSQLGPKKMSKDFKNFPKGKGSEANDIDSLVEEELSRGRSEDCSIEDEGEDGRATGPDGKTLSKHGSPSGGSGAKSNGSKSAQRS